MKIGSDARLLNHAANHFGGDGSMFQPGDFSAEAHLLAIGERGFDKRASVALTSYTSR